MFSFATKFLRKQISRMYSSSSARIGVVQMCSSNNKAENLSRCLELMKEAASKDCTMIFYPEFFDFMPTSSKENLDLAESLDGELLTALKKEAKATKLWLSLGGFQQKHGNKILNTHVVVNSSGEIVSTYEKIHLFNASINEADSVRINESNIVDCGSKAPVVVQNTPLGNLGLAVCYDVRFPELAMALRYAGDAKVLTYPASFSTPTGNAGHWEVLLRARAIETQCFVVAAAQVGKHNDRRSSFGHAMVVDPWGKILAHQERPECGLLVCDLDFAYLEKVRRELPVGEHRRFDLLVQPDSHFPQPLGDEQLAFGPKTILPEQIIYRSKLSFAFVNISPLVPGHVLVSPVEVLPRFNQMSYAQVNDLYALVRTISGPISAHFGATSLTIAIQDGEEAGQSIPHVHMHVLPRKTGDFSRNDDIYNELQNHDKDENRPLRTKAEMAEEASILRKLFNT